jgi:predicted NBD/HSP70 family sugar kinase
MDTADLTSSRRHRSRRHLLEVIRSESGLTRADLSLLTGLSRSAIAEGVQDLLNDRLIVEEVMEAGKGAGRGRPSALLVPASANGIVVGVDFGHDHVAVAVADVDGRVLDEQRAAVEVDTQARAALDTASGMVFRLLGRAGLSLNDVRTIAAGVPAPLDTRTKRIRSASIMSDWANLSPGDELASLLGRRVHTANDADMGAQGELRFGAARGLRDFIYVKVSEGVGASLVMDGSVYRGSVGLAGEIGHTQLSEQGAWCRCGNRGCLETVVSTTFVHDRMRESRIEPADAVFPLRDSAQHPVVARFVTESGRTLGKVLADVCNWLNPAGIILGGELGTAGQPLVDGVRESISRFTQPATAQSVGVRPAQLGMRSELLGAVAVAAQEALYLA